MKSPWNTVLWQQFGAAVDMLGDALRAWPDELWRYQMWHDPDDGQEYGEFWFVFYHTLHWVDLFLTGTTQGFAPPERFQRYEKGPDGRLPITPYSREDLQAYLAECRRKCQTMFEELTDQEAQAPCDIPWMKDIRFLELQLYSMRHVQEHASQLNLMLGRLTGSAPDWVPRARAGATSGNRIA